jgi:hypothetical protein
MTLKTNGSIKVMANELVGWQKKKMVGAAHLTFSAAVVRCSMHTRYTYTAVVYFTARKSFEKKSFKIIKSVLEGKRK